MIIAHIAASLCLLVAAGVALAVFLGWGSLLKTLIGNPFQKRLQFTDAWLGLVAVIAFIETCHLWLPINWKLTLIVSLIGIAGLYPIIGNSSPLCNWRSTLRKLNPLVVLVTCFLLFTWTALALTAPSIYDGGLYHFQAIRWLNEFPIVLGLGNLSGRLAFNQSYFPYLALLNIFPFFGKGYAFGGLLLMILTCATLYEAQLNKIRGGWWLNLWIMIALLPISRYLSSPSPDVAVVLTQVAIFIFLVKTYSPDLQDQANTGYSAIMVFFLSCLLVAIKLSGVIFAFMAILLLIPCIRSSYSKYKRAYLASFLIGSYFIAIHLLRGVLLSGLPLYPSSLGAIWSVDWSVTRTQAIDEANWIYSWARDASKMPNEVLSSWAWFPAWADSFMGERWRYVYGALILVTIDLISLVTSKSAKQENKLFILFVPFVVAIIFWFLTAPDWRFLGAIPQLVIGLSGWLFIRRCIPREVFLLTDKFPSYTASSLVALTILVLMTKTADFKTLPLSGWHDIPQVEVEMKETYSGLSIWVPVSGDQCWDSALPCAPKLNDELYLRGGKTTPESPKEGFRVQK
jgi:hypothetical protein